MSLASFLIKGSMMNPQTKLLPSAPTLELCCRIINELKIGFNYG